MQGLRAGRLFAMAVAFAGLLAHGTGAAVAGDPDPFAPLTAADAGPSVVADRVTAIAEAQSFGANATSKGTLTLVMPGTDAERAGALSRLSATLAGELEALHGLGLDAPEMIPPLTIVHVHAKAGKPFAVWASSGASVLAIRDVDGWRVSDTPGPPARPDGPPLLRDAVESSRRARLWIDEHEVTAGARFGGPGSPAFEIARHAVRASLGPDGGPAWIADALAGWAERRVAPPKAEHVCKPYFAGKPEMLVQLVTAVPRPPSGTRFLARVFGVLVDGRPDAAARLAALRAATTPADKAIESAFGTPCADVLAKACAGLKASDCACDDAMTVGCPVCKGTGRIPLDCPDCEGSGYNVCPTCRGTDMCPTACIAGIFFIGIEEVKCKVCVGGKVKCAACSGAQRVTCKACSGHKTTAYPCLVCNATGRLPCPDAGVAAPDTPPGTKCPWCQDPARKFTCPDCGGAGYLGCGACHGTLKIPCSRCGGAGQTPGVYNTTYGPFVAGRTCDLCEGKGFSKCEQCKAGRRPCAACGGKGLRTTRPDDCPACVDGVLPVRSELSATRVFASPPLNSKESEAARVSTTKAVAFLLSSSAGGGFALRESRAEGQTKAGALDEPTLFSNSLCLWALALAGVDPKDPRVSRQWAILRREAAAALQQTGYDARTQATAFALRALVLGGEDVHGQLVASLVDKICKAQRPSGWWGGWLDPKSYDDPFDTQIVVESLRMARIKGAKVPREVWDKVLRAASGTFDSKGPKSVRSELVGATEVLSNLSLVVIAKEAMLGAKATSFDYTTLPAVKGGLAWLDRHFDVRSIPTFVKGAPIRGGSDSGYAAYVFAVQRLAVLLNIEVLAGDNWHAGGFRHLLPLQYDDGSFEERAPGHLNGPVRTTVSCVLFLLRATAPITDVKDD